MRLLQSGELSPLGSRRSWFQLHFELFDAGLAKRCQVAALRLEVHLYCAADAVNKQLFEPDGQRIALVVQLTFERIAPQRNVVQERLTLPFVRQPENERSPRN